MSDGQGASPVAPPGPAGLRGTEGSATVPLNSEDRAILALEGPTIAGHTCKVIRLGPPAPSPAALSEAIAARLSLAPSLTWRLGGSAEAPYWQPDPAFDVHAHIGLAPLAAATAKRPDDPTAGNPDEVALRREVAGLFLQRLDRARPLWRIDLVGPLANGDTVLVWKVHHALAGGNPGE